MTSVFKISFLSLHCETWEIRKVAVSNPIVSKSILKLVPCQINGKTPTDFSRAKILSMIWNKGVIFPDFHNKYFNLVFIYALQNKILRFCHSFIGIILPLYFIFCQLTRDELQTTSKCWA